MEQEELKPTEHPQEGYQPRSVFSGMITGQEFWLIGDRGYLPVGVVMGTTVYSLGLVHGKMAQMRSTFRGEVREIANMLAEARTVALERMHQHAEELGADGVLRVKIQERYLRDGEFFEVCATGTAVRYVGKEDAGQSVQLTLDLQNSEQVVLPYPGEMEEDS